MPRKELSDRELMALVDRQAEILDPGHFRRVTESQGVLSPLDERPYVTRSDHDGIPAGTPCLVSRPGDGRMLRLAFEDGRVSWALGYAAEIEWALERRTAEYAERMAAQRHGDDGGQST